MPGFADPRPICRECWGRIDPMDLKARTKHKPEECIAYLKKELEDLKRFRALRIKHNEEMEIRTCELANARSALSDAWKDLERVRDYMVTFHKVLETLEGTLRRAMSGGSDGV